MMKPVGIRNLMVTGIILVCLIQCGKNKDIKKYSKYKIYFKYPASFHITEIPILSDKMNKDSGLVQVGVENKEIEFFQVSWIKTAQYNLEAGLSTAATSLTRMDGYQSIKLSDISEMRKLGHKMIYQEYILRTDNKTLYGIIGIMYCTNSSRIMTLISINNKYPDKKENFENFLQYINSFKCHK